MKGTLLLNNTFSHVSALNNMHLDRIWIAFLDACESCFEYMNPHLGV